MELTIEQALQQGVAAHKEGKVQDAEKLYRAILQSQPLHPDANHNLGLIAVSVNKADAALPLFKTALEANPKMDQFWLSYIDALIKEKQFETASKILEQGKKEGLSGNKVDALEIVLTPTIQVNESKSALQKKRLTLSEKRKKLADNKKQKKAKKQHLKGQPSEAEINNLLQYYQNGQYEDAEKLALATTQRFPEYQLAYKVLGSVLTKAGRTNKALVANQRSVQLGPKDAQAHSNLGNTLQALGKLEEAEESYREAIALNSSYTETYYNLGFTLKVLGRLEEAEARFRQAIAKRPDDALAHYQMALVLYINGDIDSGLESLKKAYNIDPKSQDIRSTLAILKSRKYNEKIGVRVGELSNLVNLAVPIPNQLIFNRVVEAELIDKLYEMNSIEVERFDNGFVLDVRYGNGRCSTDFQMFEGEGESSILKGLKEDLINIMKRAVKSEVYINDSFFNIIGAGGGTTPHMHLNKNDEDERLNFGKQKYSLVYYLSVGDQNCSEPGVLKLYDPNEEILPVEGMIVIIPAGRRHSAVYGGKKDGVMIGINFYSL